MKVCAHGMKVCAQTRSSTGHGGGGGRVGIESAGSCLRDEVGCCSVSPGWCTCLELWGEPAGQAGPGVLRGSVLLMGATHRDTLDSAQHSCCEMTCGHGWAEGWAMLSCGRLHGRDQILRCAQGTFDAVP